MVAQGLALLWMGLDSSRLGPTMDGALTHYDSSRLGPTMDGALTQMYTQVAN